MTSVLWGLMGALLIGGSDCIARVTARQVSLGVLVLCVMLFSFIALSIHAIAFDSLPAWHTQGWLYSAISGSLNVIVLILLYKALVRGPVAVASPTASVFVILLLGLNVLSGESWTVWQVLATFIVFGGIFMLSRRSSADADTHYDAAWLRLTVLYALSAAFAVSIRMFLAQEAGDLMGAMYALYLNRAFALVAVCVLITVQLLKGMQLNWPSGRSLLGLVALQAILETLALGAFLMGSLDGNRVAATIGFAGFAAATTIIARIWLGEKIGLQRSIWISVVAVGVVLAVMATP
jgi:drug/metabolite transporter (DMT)-like permease